MNIRDVSAIPIAAARRCIGSKGLIAEAAMRIELRDGPPTVPQSNNKRKHPQKLKAFTGILSFL